MLSTCLALYCIIVPNRVLIKLLVKLSLIKHFIISIAVYQSGAIVSFTFGELYYVDVNIRLILQDKYSEKKMIIGMLYLL